MLDRIKSQPPGIVCCRIAQFKRHPPMGHLVQNNRDCEPQYPGANKKPGLQRHHCQHSVYHLNQFNNFTPIRQLFFLAKNSSIWYKSTYSLQTTHNSLNICLNNVQFAKKHPIRETSGNFCEDTTTSPPAACSVRIYRKPRSTGNRFLPALNASGASPDQKPRQNKFTALANGSLL